MHAAMGRAFLVMMFVLSVTPASAQTPRQAPNEGYGLHDERAFGPFTVQRWVNSKAPEVSPAGMCDCITVVYTGARLVLTFGNPGATAAFAVNELSGSDINRDGRPDLIMSAWSGGAHCCYSNGVYSVGEDVKAVLVVETGNCSGMFEDLDGDGTREFITCDDQWAYAYCSFADSPLPRVIYSYNNARGMYVPDTPRFASRYREELATVLDEAQTWLSESGGKDPGVDKCRLLRPALGLMYGGRFYDGLVLIRGLYRGADREQFERETIERVKQSTLWVDR
jgi:hypothetical protein